jgi:uncharacterized membrane protein
LTVLNTTRIYMIGFMLIFLGIAFLFVGLFSSGNSSTGVIVFIGPIPIAFGSGSNSGVLLIIGFVAAIAIILYFYVSTRQERSPVWGADERQQNSSH